MNLSSGVWKLIDDLSRKKGISEIIINSIDNIYVERESEMIRLNAQFSLNDIKTFCQEVAQFNKVQFGNKYPILDGVLPDGSRINIISEDYTQNTPAITIRRYLKFAQKFDENVGMFGLSQKWIHFFKQLVNAKMNIIISGGTGTGKTTLLNFLLQEIPLTQRIITIEDTKELSLLQPNTVRLVSRSTSFLQDSSLGVETLLKNALRMRPDRIIIGEVRGAEAFDLLQAMNTGHAGSMCTLHANGTAESLSRLESLFLFAGNDIPIRAVRKQMSTAIDFIVQISKNKEGQRIISKISEVVGMEGDNILMQDIGNQSENGPLFTGLVPKRMEILKSLGMDPSFFAEV